jgi:hexosaminidase
MFQHDLIFLGFVASDQELVDNLARYLNIQYDVLDNFANTWKTFDGQLTFTNKGPDIPAGDSKPWSLFFCHVRFMEPDRIRPNGAELGTTGLKVFHVNGCLHKIEPTSTFLGIVRDVPLYIPFRASDWEIARSDVMPNWYVTSPGATARTISSTAGYELDWVGKFDTPNKWKRQPDDTYNPYTGSDRLALWDHRDTGTAKYVIPTPISETLDPTQTMNIYMEDWVVVWADTALEPEAHFLAGKIYRFSIFSF